MSACERCNLRDAAPGYEMCRACRYYERSLNHGEMLKVTAFVDRKLVEEMRAEARSVGESLSYVIRGRLARAGKA